MTKQKILDYNMGNANEEWYDGLNPIQEMRVLDAMEQYAKQEAIKFAKFVMDKAWQDLSTENNWVVELTYGEMKDYTDEELYSLYLKLKEG